MSIDFTQATEDQCLSIPYRSGTGYGAGHPNVGFIDILNEPERIDEIPELEGFSGFKDLIQFFNSKGSAFVSLRVDSGENFFPRDNFPSTCFTFFTVGVQRLHPQQDRIVLELIRSEFCKYVEGVRLPRFAHLEFRISGLNIPGHNYNGTCLDVFIHGFGFSMVSARRAHLAAFHMISDFFRDFNDRLVGHEFDDSVIELSVESEDTV